MDIESILSDAKASPIKEPLEANREAILILRKKGYSWRDISDFLAKRGISVDHTKIYRFMNKLKTDKEVTIMNKGLYIAENYYINLAKISSWLNEDNHMQPHLDTTEDLNLVDIELKGKSGSFSRDSAFKVEINEFKRIERKINEFMEISSS